MHGFNPNMIYFNKKDKYSTIPYKNNLFTAINISTPSKGPIYALAKGNGKTITKEIISCSINMNYYIKDTPIDEEISFNTFVNIDSGCNPHSIYPLILQIMNINEFLENQCDSDFRIHLNSIFFKTTSGTRMLSEEFSDKKVRKVIESLGTMTDMNSIVGNNSFINLHIPSNYSITDEITDKVRFDTKRLLCFPEIETAYLIIGMIYEELASLNNMIVTVKSSYRFRRVHTDNLVDEINATKSETRSVTTYHAITLDQIIRLFIYVPQLIRIERSLFDVDTTIEIMIERGGKEITLLIPNNEYTIDFSLYDIVCNLLQALRSMV